MFPDARRTEHPRAMPEFLQGLREVMHDKLLSPERGEETVHVKDDLHDAPSTASGRRATGGSICMADLEPPQLLPSASCPAPAWPMAADDGVGAAVPGLIMARPSRCAGTGAPINSRMVAGRWMASASGNTVPAAIAGSLHGPEPPGPVAAAAPIRNGTDAPVLRVVNHIRRLVIPEHDEVGVGLPRPAVGNGIARLDDFLDDCACPCARSPGDTVRPSARRKAHRIRQAQRCPAARALAG